MGSEALRVGHPLVTEAGAHPGTCEAGQVQGRKARFFIYVDGKRVLIDRKGEASSSRWSRKFAKRTGRHVVQVFVNGSLVDQVGIRTGKKRRR